MKKVTVVFTDNAKDEFNCKNVSYDRHVAFLGTTDDETVVIPYRNVYEIKVREVME